MARRLTQPGNWQRARLTWDGEATLASGTIRNARGYAFDSPAEGLRSVAPDRVSWRSITAGDWDGIILEIDGAPSARLCFRSAPASFDLPLSQLEKGPHSVIANGFRASVEVRYLPAELPLAWHGSFRDESIEAGVNPYWILCAAGGRFPGVEQSGLHSLRAPVSSGACPPIANCPPRVPRPRDA